jgi:hypothetical protein
LPAAGIFSDPIEIPLYEAETAAATFVDLDAGEARVPPFAVTAYADRGPVVAMTPQLTAWMEQNHVSLVVVTDKNNLAVAGYGTRAAAFPKNLPEGILDVSDAKAQADAKAFEVSEANDIVAAFLPPRRIEEGDNRFYFSDIEEFRHAFPYRRAFHTGQGTVGLMAVVGPADEKAYNARPAEQRARPEKLSLRIKRVRPGLVLQVAVGILPDLSTGHAKFAEAIKAGDAPGAIKAAEEFFPKLESFCFLMHGSAAGPTFDSVLEQEERARAAVAGNDLAAAKKVMDALEPLGSTLVKLAQDTAEKAVESGPGAP